MISWYLGSSVTPWSVFLRDWGRRRGSICSVSLACTSEIQGTKKLLSTYLSPLKQPFQSLLNREQQNTYLILKKKKKEKHEIWISVTHCQFTPEKYPKLTGISTTQCSQWQSVQAFPGHDLQLQWQWGQLCSQDNKESSNTGILLGGMESAQHLYMHSSPKADSAYQRGWGGSCSLTA